MASEIPELVPVRVRNAVREAVGGWGLYTVSQIAGLFADEGFKPSREDIGDYGGQRRTECELYQAVIDWTSPSESRRYLLVVDQIIRNHEAAVRANDGAVAADLTNRLEKVQGALTRSGIRRGADGLLELPTPSLTAAMRLQHVPTESDIRLHVERLGRLDQEPEETIGAAKDLVEAAAKHVLTEFGDPVSPNSDVAALSKQALHALHLHPGAIAPTAKGSAETKRMLAGLHQIAVGLAELRNEGYGTGHGRGRRIPRIKRRHADFVARSAIAYTEMVLDTLHDPDAPWHQKGSSA
jgi:hypothetical protein